MWARKSPYETSRHHDVRWRVPPVAAQHYVQCNTTPDWTRLQHGVSLPWGKAVVLLTPCPCPQLLQAARWALCGHRFRCFRRLVFYLLYDSEGVWDSVLIRHHDIFILLPRVPGGRCPSSLPSIVCVVGGGGSVWLMHTDNYYVLYCCAPVGAVSVYRSIAMSYLRYSYRIPGIIFTH